MLRGQNALDTVQPFPFESVVSMTFPGTIPSSEKWPPTPTWSSRRWPAKMPQGCNQQGPTLQICSSWTDRPVSLLGQTGYPVAPGGIPHSVRQPQPDDRSPDGPFD